jgi:ankyrin repeat protein
VEKLLKWGAKVDQPHNHNRTALLLAAQRGHCDVMRVLLDKGADIRALFTITGSKIHNALHVAAHEGDVALMQTLLAGGADVTAIAHSGDLADRRIEATIAGKTPLEVAENADQKEAVEFLKSAVFQYTE